MVTELFNKSRFEDYLNPGTVVGYQDLITDDDRSMTCISVKQVKLLQLSKKDYISILPVS